MRVQRFNKTTRWFHWSFALSFVSLGATGALLVLREELSLDAAGIARLVELHKLAALSLLVLPPVVWLSGETRRTADDLRQVLRWSRDDLRWLRLQPLAALGRAKLPAAGKLNAGQKLNALLTLGLSLGLAASGAVLWNEPSALAAWVVHLSLFLAWLPVFAGHLFLALVNPGTRHALRGMTRGDVDLDWARHHHAAWVESMRLEEVGAAASRPRPRLVPLPGTPEAARAARGDPELEQVVDGEA